MERFSEALEKHHILLNSHQKEQFEIYYQLLIEWNEKMNLTAITDRDEVYLKHFYDSLAPLFFTEFPQNARICDVGAGAGFPSLPLKIIRPDLKISIVDSLNKRIIFLSELIKKLNVADVALYHERAEIFAQLPEQREGYDFVTARAVARLNVLAELCLPLVKVGGSFIALKASKAKEELADAEKALKILGGEVASVKEWNLPDSKDPRTLIIIKKIKKTPQKYPRKAGTPNRKPL